MSLRFIRLIAAAVVMIAAGAESVACTCLPPRPPLKALARADAVFSGKVTVLEEGPVQHPGDDSRRPGKHATIRVLQSWKGEVRGEVQVHTGIGLGDCGSHFERGESYLFYAVKTAPGIWYTHSCSRTGLLKPAAREILELEGRLPTPSAAPADPIFELEGKINDAGYDGYIFSLRNRLHERIFYLGYNGPPGYCIQVMKDGTWIDFPPQEFTKAWQAPPKDPKQAYTAWKEQYEKLDVEGFAAYVDPGDAAPVFVTPLTRDLTWRVGFQYLTESEVDAGKQIQTSKRFAWSTPISSKIKTRTLTFKEAFGEQ